MNRLLLGLLGILTLPCPGRAEDLRVFSSPQIEAIGRELYETERRIDIALDLMHENYDVEQMKIGAWVTEGKPNHLLVRFVRFSKGMAEAVLEAKFDDLLIPAFSQPTQKELSRGQENQLAARQVVEPNIQSPCSSRFESLVTQDPSGDGLLLYAIAMAADPHTVLLGGHYRFSLSANGAALHQTDALSTSCAKATLSDLQSTDGSKGIAVRANLSDTPLETHVYLSLHYHVPLFVVTRDLKMWEIRNGHMRIIRKKPGEDSPKS